MSSFTTERLRKLHAECTAIVIDEELDDQEMRESAFLLGCRIGTLLHRRRVIERVIQETAHV